MGAGLAVASRWLRPSRAQSTPRIVIVGGGLAGLSAAYHLRTYFGLDAKIYEASDRFGGRASTQSGFGGQHIERGGQFISSGDRSLRRLARALGVGLIDTYEIGSDGEDKLHFRGRDVTRANLATALSRAEDNAFVHAREAGRTARFDRHNARTEYWDNRSVADWIDNYCPGGIDGDAGRYLRTSFETEYAGPAQEASALQIIYDLGLSTPAAAYDERYFIAGGTESIVTALVQRLSAPSLHLRTILRRLRPNLDGSVRCSFEVEGNSADVDADRVLLALPFSVLRDVDYAPMGFDARKHDAIQGLGMGVNAKVHLQFESAPWLPTYSGDSISDLTSGATWAESLGQVGPRHTLVLFNGGAYAAQYGATPAHATAPTAVADSHLSAIDSLFPGASGAFSGQAYLDNWLVDPWVKGSYSFYKVGQMTTIAGYEGVPQGPVHFAGEHTATKYIQRATLNGAVDSGMRVAREMARSLR